MNKLYRKLNKKKVVAIFLVIIIIIVIIGFIVFNNIRSSQENQVETISENLENSEETAN